MLTLFKSNSSDAGSGHGSDENGTTRLERADVPYVELLKDHD